MFNPVYMIVNSMILGRGDQHAKLAAFGLGSSTNSMLLVCTGSVFASAANILVSQAYGANDIRLCRIYLHR